MLLAGDEFLRTQRGNNNAWCQDNDFSWIDWSQAEKHADFLRFTLRVDRVAKAASGTSTADVFPGTAAVDGRGGRGLARSQAGRAGFFQRESNAAPCLDGRHTGREPDRDFYLACNAHREPLSFQVPQPPTGGRWRCAIDTLLPAPHDIVEPGEGPVISALASYTVGPFALVVLISEA